MIFQSVSVDGFCVVLPTLCGCACDDEDRNLDPTCDLIKYPCFSHAGETGSGRVGGGGSTNDVAPNLIGFAWTANSYFSVNVMSSRFSLKFETARSRVAASIGFEAEPEPLLAFS
jgi:hypothetical protein